MVLISFLTFVSMVLISNLAFKVRLEWALFFSSLVLSVSIFSITNIHAIILFVSVLILFWRGKVLVRLSYLPFMVVFLIIIFLYLVLGLSNNLTLYPLLGKFFKISLIVFLLTLYIKDVTKSDIKGFLIVYISLSFLFWPINMLSVGVRNAGLSYDPNYMAILSFVFLVFYSKFHCGFDKIKLFLIALIASSLSVTVLICLSFSWLLYLIFKEKKLKIQFTLLFMGFVFLYVYTLYLYTGFNSSEVQVYQNWESSSYEMKLNSYLFRLIAQIKALELISTQTNYLLFGYGPSHSVFLFGIPLHNGYLQLLFDHGIFLTLSLLIFIFYRLSSMPIYCSVFIYLTNYSFDNISYFIASSSVMLITYNMSMKKSEI